MEAKVGGTVDASQHKTLYPEQYTHELVGKTVRLKQQKRVLGVVERVFNSAFGTLASIVGNDNEAWSIAHVEVVPERLAPKKAWAIHEVRSIEGYDIFAHALDMDGREVRVLNNNGSHFLVVRMADPGDYGKDHAELLGTVGYADDDDDGHGAYVTALTWMIGFC